MQNASRWEFVPLFDFDNLDVEPYEANTFYFSRAEMAQSLKEGEGNIVSWPGTDEEF